MTQIIPVHLVNFGKPLQKKPLVASATYCGVVDLALKRSSSKSEAEALQEMRHPNIVPLMGTVGSWLAFRYIPDRSLFEICADRKVGLPWTRRFQIGRQVVQARQYLLGRKFYRWNLSTVNIFISKDFVVKLGGFCGPGATDQRKTLSLGAVLLELGARGVPVEETVQPRSVSVPFCPPPYADFLCECLGKGDLTLSFEKVEERVLRRLQEMGQQVEKGVCCWQKRNYRQAAVHFKLGAMVCDPRAQYWYGRCCWEGKGCKKDEGLGARYLDLAVAQGDLDAIKLLAGRSVVDLKFAADSGDANAQYKLAVAYQSGQGVALDQRLGFDYCLRAADQNLAEAQFTVGICFEYAEGVSEDPLLALHYYTLAGTQGHMKARRASNRLRPEYAAGGIAPGKLARFYFKRALSYRKGIGHPQDNRVAAVYFKLATSLGLSEAETNLGLCFLQGCGVPKDARQGVFHLQNGARKGDKIAHYNLGACYKNGRGVAIDLEQAAWHYACAGDLGMATGQYEAGLCYERLGNLEKARLYYLIASEQKHPQADIGYLRLAARMGDKSAQLRLGYYYEKGAGVPDLFRLRLAAKFYTLAANQGVPGAQFRIAQFYTRGLGVPKNLKTGFNYWMRAASQGHIASLRQVAKSYKLGRGVAKSDRLSSLFLKKLGEL